VLAAAVSVPVVVVSVTVVAVSAPTTVESVLVEVAASVCSATKEFDPLTFNAIMFEKS